MRREEITVALAADLITSQFPHWAHLPVAPVELGGWDNVTFRLGDRLSVRLPSAERYAAKVDKEHRWLPVLARGLPVAIPESLAVGAPGCGYPWPWSVRRWIEGERADVVRALDLDRFATDVAAFLAALHRVDTAGGPEPGAHNFHRGGSLAVYDDQARAAIASLDGEIDALAATSIWETALRARWTAAPLWVHGDMSASNMLVANGRLAAVLDFGGCAVGDPACDLVLAWTFLGRGSRAAFRDGVPLGDSTWARARGWALWKAAITLEEAHRGGVDADAAARRQGWRGGARHVLDEVLADPVGAR